MVLHFNTAGYVTDRFLKLKWLYHALALHDCGKHALKTLPMYSILDGL